MTEEGEEKAHRHAGLEDSVQGPGYAYKDATLGVMDSIPGMNPDSRETGYV